MRMVDILEFRELTVYDRQFWKDITISIRINMISYSATKEPSILAQGQEISCTPTTQKNIPAPAIHLFTPNPSEATIGLIRKIQAAAIPFVITACPSHFTLLAKSPEGGLAVIQTEDGRLTLDIPKVLEPNLKFQAFTYPEKGHKSQWALLPDFNTLLMAHDQLKQRREAASRTRLITVRDYSRQPVTSQANKQKSLRSSSSNSLTTTGRLYSQLFYSKFFYPKLSKSYQKIIAELPPNSISFIHWYELPFHGSSAPLLVLIPYESLLQLQLELEKHKLESNVCLVVVGVGLSGVLSRNVVFASEKIQDVLAFIKKSQFQTSKESLKAMRKLSSSELSHLASLDKKSIISSIQGSQINFNRSDSIMEQLSVSLSLKPLNSSDPQAQPLMLESKSANRKADINAKDQTKQLQTLAEILDSQCQLSKKDSKSSKLVPSPSQIKPDGNPQLKIILPLSRKSLSTPDEPLEQSKAFQKLQAKTILNNSSNNNLSNNKRVQRVSSNGTDASDTLMFTLESNNSNNGFIKTSKVQPQSPRSIYMIGLKKNSCMSPTRNQKVQINPYLHASQSAAVSEDKDSNYLLKLIKKPYIDSVKSKISQSSEKPVEPAKINSKLSQPEENEQTFQSFNCSMSMNSAFGGRTNPMSNVEEGPAGRVRKSLKTVSELAPRNQNLEQSDELVWNGNFTLTGPIQAVVPKNLPRRASKGKPIIEALNSMRVSSENQCSTPKTIGLQKRSKGYEVPQLSNKSSNNEYGNFTDTIKDCSEIAFNKSHQDEKALSIKHSSGQSNKNNGFSSTQNQSGDKSRLMRCRRTERSPGSATKSRLHSSESSREWQFDGWLSKANASQGTVEEAQKNEQRLYFEPINQQYSLAQQAPILSALRRRQMKESGVALNEGVTRKRLNSYSNGGQRQADLDTGIYSFRGQTENHSKVNLYAGIKQNHLQHLEQSPGKQATDRNFMNNFVCSSNSNFQTSPTHYDKGTHSGLVFNLNRGSKRLYSDHDKASSYFGVLEPKTNLKSPISPRLPISENSKLKGLTFQAIFKTKSTFGEATKENESLSPFKCNLRRPSQKIEQPVLTETKGPMLDTVGGGMVPIQASNWLRSLRPPAEFGTESQAPQDRQNIYMRNIKRQFEASPRRASHSGRHEEVKNASANKRIFSPRVADTAGKIPSRPGNLQKPFTYFNPI